MFKNTREASSKQEKSISKSIQGRRTPNSGATKFIKGDIVTEQFIIEAKTCMTPKNSFSIKKEWLEKLREEQYAMGKMYNALCFDFGDEKQRYYILDESTFQYIKELLENQ